MRKTQDTTVSSQYKSLIMNIFIVAPQKGIKHYKKHEIQTNSLPGLTIRIISYKAPHGMCPSPIPPAIAAASYVSRYSSIIKMMMFIERATALKS